jgi:hypothetical protein
MTGIAKSAVHKIISDLNFRKVSARWVLKMLTEEHKSKRIAASFENLCCYQDNSWKASLREMKHRFINYRIIVNTIQCDSICRYLLPLHVLVS